MTEAAKTMDSTDLWISVTERLPKRPWRVLVAYQKRFRKDRVGKRYEIFDARYSGGAWRFLSPALKTRLSERVTHWQPLPRAPQ